MFAVVSGVHDVMHVSSCWWCVQDQEKMHFEAAAMHFETAAMHFEAAAMHFEAAAMLVGDVTCQAVS